MKPRKVRKDLEEVRQSPEFPGRYKAVTPEVGAVLGAHIELFQRQQPLIDKDDATNQLPMTNGLY
jgi:hypothetical protein